MSTFGLSKEGHWQNAKKNDKVWMYMVEKAKSGRARCRRCSDVVPKDGIRFGIPIRDPRGEHGYISAWQHVACSRVDPLEEGTPGSLKDYIAGFDKLSEEDQALTLKEVTSTERPAHLQELEPDDLVKREACAPMDPPDCVTQHLLPFQKEGLAWMVEQEKSDLKGGILADEMGMGKTIQSISLIATNRGVGPTLVVCPVSSMLQWQEEIVNHIVPGELKVVVFSKTKKATKGELEVADVVLTSYPVLELSWRQIVNREKVPCKYCKQLFLPRKLSVHNKYFCGPNAKKTAKQSKQEKSGGGGGAGRDNKKQSKATIKKGLRTLHVDVDEDELPDEAVEADEVPTNKEEDPKVERAEEEPPKKKSRMDSGAAKATTKGGKKEEREDKIKDELENDEKPRNKEDNAIGESQTVAKAVSEGKIAGPMGMYRELMAEAGRSARSRWDRKREKPESSSSNDSDSSGSDSDSSGSGSDDSTTSESDGSSSGGRGSKKNKTLVASKNTDTKVRKGKGVKVVSEEVEEDTTLADLKAKVTCPDCEFPLRKFLFCPKNGTQHVWEKLAGIDEGDADVGGDAVDLSMSILHSIKWFRIVLDEAHRIKSRSTGTTRSAFALQAERKWCITGTPLQNRVGDLYSLLRFLKFAPYARYFCSVADCTCSCLSHPFTGLQLRACIFCGHGPLQHYSYFNKHIMNPIIRYGYVGDGRKALMLLTGTVLNKIMLRRTKEERANDMKLPPCTVEVKYIEPTEEETDFYTSLYKKSTSNFDTFVTKGTVLHNYAHIFQLLSRLRQALDHPYLVAFSQAGDGSSLVSADALPAISVSNKDVCAICMEDVTRSDTVELAPCKHRFHRLCLRQYFDAMPEDEKMSCPKCFNVVSLDLRKLSAGEDLEEADDEEDEGGAKKVAKGDAKPSAPSKKSTGSKKKVSLGLEEDDTAPISALLDEDEEDDDDDEMDFQITAVPPPLEEEEEEDAAPLAAVKDDEEEDEIDWHDSSAAPTAGGGDTGVPGRKSSDIKTTAPTASGGDSSGTTTTTKRIKKSSILNRFDTSKFATSTKLEAIVKHIHDTPKGEKVIVFSQFGMMLDLIEFRLERSGIRTVKLNGSMQLSARQSSLKAFRTVPTVKVILISLKAGGEGLNLQNANHVILTDPWWNPAVEMQAVQRAHRIGQTRPVTAVRFVTKDTIEERMLQLQDKKMLVFEGTVDGKVSSVKSLSEEDLQFLFQ